MKFEHPIRMVAIIIFSIILTLTIVWTVRSPRGDSVGWCG